MYKYSVHFYSDNKHNILILLLICDTNLNVKLVDPDGQVGVGVQIEVIHGLLDSIEDVRKGLVIEHASVQRANLQIDFLLNQQEIIHLKITRSKTKKVCIYTRRTKLLCDNSVTPTFSWKLKTVSASL